MEGDLVQVGKAGETLLVHRTCVAAHEAAGWVVTPQQAPPAQTESQPKAKKARGSSQSSTEATNGDR